MDLNDFLDKLATRAIVDAEVVFDGGEVIVMGMGDDEKGSFDINFSIDESIFIEIICERLGIKIIDK